MNNLPEKPRFTLQGAKEWLQTELNKGPNQVLLKMIFLTIMFILVVIWLPNSSVEINIRLNDLGPRESTENSTGPDLVANEELNLMPVKVETHVSTHSILEERPAKKKTEKKKRKKTVGPNWMHTMPKSAMDEKQLFILKYHEIALQEQEKYGIPASIKLAQALVETNAGNSRLFKKANNAFGIKGIGPRGYVRADDDAPREKFRKYESVWRSFRDHSEFLQQPRYQRLQSARNYREWAKGLKRCGYATAPHYASALIRMVERYDLSKFDK